MTMEAFLPVGKRATFRKTVSESDVYLFAGITGDLSPNHVDEAAMKDTPYGGRIAHGALIIGYMSATSTKIVEDLDRARFRTTPVSLGYDRIRFLKAVFIGDTIEVTYEVKSVDWKKMRSSANIIVVNQHGETVAVAEHILKFVVKDSQETTMSSIEARRKRNEDAT
jgi:3-hydroxybutyryl-CoA dehydratase